MFELGLLEDTGDTDDEILQSAFPSLQFRQGRPVIVVSSSADL
jgi:hypothetical protein